MPWAPVGITRISFPGTRAFSPGYSFSFRPQLPRHQLFCQLRPDRLLSIGHGPSSACTGWTSQDRIRAATTRESGQASPCLIPLDITRR